MVLPKKKTLLTKSEEQLKKKLKKLFKDEDFDNNNVKPTTSQFYKYEEYETSTISKKPNSNSNSKKLNSAKGTKKSAPTKKLKKTTKAYYEQEISYDGAESSPACNTSNECNCSESYSSAYESKSDEFNYKSKNEKRELNECYDSDTDDSVEFEQLKKLATKELIKSRLNKNKIKAIKSNGNSSYSDEQISKKSIKKIKENSKNLSKKKKIIKSENKSKSKIKKSCKDNNDSSEYFTDDSNDDSEPAACGRKSNGIKKSRKRNNRSDDWKTESVQDNNKSETKSDYNYSTDQVDSNNIIYGNVKKSPKVQMEKKEENEKDCKINGNIKNNSKKSKKLKNAKKSKEEDQKLVPYHNSNSNLSDNDSAEDNVEEIMKLYGIESTDDEQYNGEEDETDEDYSLSNSDEYDSEETDSEGSKCEEEDYDSEYSSDNSNGDDFDSHDHENCDDYNFETESDDEDYNLPENCEEDLYIPQGIATKYDINGYDIVFDSENEAQIIEIPTENIEKSIEENIEKEVLSIQNYESDDSCPQLVPISFENQTTNNSEKNYDFSETDEYSESDYSDCCSEYTEATEGSLCFENNMKDLKPEEATIMLPEVFDLSSEILQNPNITLNQLDNCDYNDDSEMEIDNPLEKIMNNSNISNTSTSYKITTIGGVQVNITSSKISQQQLLRKSIKTNISTEIANNNNLDKFETKFYNAIDSCHVLVLLREPIYIYGTIKIKLIAGNIEIFGYQPDLNETLEIYSPRGYSFLDIKSIKNRENIDEKVLSKIIFQDIDESIFLKFDLNNIINNFNSKTDALILLKRNDCNKKIEMLRKYMKENLFPNMNSITLDRPFYSSEFILHCLIRIQPNNSIHIDPKWQTIKTNSNTKTMIIGGKSVGKSTLTRYLINKNIKIFKKILLIDLDIGQPELFIPQTISVYILDCPLLGPGYYLGLEPKKSLIFGEINAILSPIEYLKNIQILLKYCQSNEEFQNIPWIVNTMGYVKGFGNELIAAIIKYLQPTDIIQLQSSRQANNFDYLMYPTIVQTIPLNVYSENDLNLVNDVELNHHLILFDSIMNGRNTIKSSSERDMNSKDIRYAMIVTRLGAALNKCDWLTDVKPICAPMDDIEIICFDENNLTKEELLDVINANLVYLCNKSTNNHIDCYGIGIVRGVDRLHRKIYLLPAVPIEILTNVNCFAVCNIPLPTSILLNQGPKIKGIVPYAYNTNKVIASKSVHQLYNRGQKRKASNLM